MSYERELDYLIHRYLEGTLSEDEAKSLSERVSRDAAAANLLAKMAYDQKFLGRLFRTPGEVESVRQPLPSITGPSSADRDGGAASTARPVTRRTRRRQAVDKKPSWGAWALAAAGIMAGAAIFIALSPSEPDPAASQRAAEARTRAAREAAAERLAERDRLEREREETRAEAQQKRLEAEARLRELEEKRKLLSQVKPQPQENPQAKANREKDLAELKRDQERVEQELRDAAELAKKAAPPAAPVAPPQEKLPQPQKDPASPSQGTTLAALATVEEVGGEAFRVTPAGKVPLEKGTGISAREGLSTGAGASRIVLRFLDKTRVEFGPDTTLRELTTDSGKHLALSRGTLHAVVAKQPVGEPMMITTPHGMTKVLGTTLRIIIDPDPKRGTRLDVEEGKVELKNLAEKTVLVESGYFAVAAESAELVARRQGSVLFSDTFAAGVMAPGWNLQPASGYWSVVKGALVAAGPTLGNWDLELASINLPIGAISWEAKVSRIASISNAQAGIVVSSADGKHEVFLKLDQKNNLVWATVDLTRTDDPLGKLGTAVGTIDGSVSHAYKFVLERDATFTLLVDGETKATRILAGPPSVWARGIARASLTTMAESGGQALSVRFTNVVVR